MATGASSLLFSTFLGGTGSDTANAVAADLSGIYVAVSSYRGLMTSPAVGRIMAALVLDGDTNDPILNQLSPCRFKAGKMLSEPLLNQE